MANFDGKTIIVTGAGSGIGQATAEMLFKNGANVIAADIDEARLQELAGQYPGIKTVAGDITSNDTIEEIIAAISDKLDGLANVAGIMDDFLPPSEVDDDTWDKVMSVNLTGPMRLTRAALPQLIDSKGKIVNVASEASFRASAAGAAYTASKHALVGYTKSLAFFYGSQGVRANAIAPGAVETNIQADMGKSKLAAERIGPIIQATMTPVAQAEELASAICWLLSDESANINGAIIPSDGGWSVV
ncbi:SDR family oxidoreductase [Candidatus Saccharibacteria bacterium]|nr:SDR family oxidoreductase [Candidatus Saccharibacteria bacterium]